MNIKNVNLNKESLTNDGGMILTEVRHAYQYKDGQRTDTVVGLKVTVALEKNHYDTLTVTVAGQMDTLSSVLKKAEGPVYVDFDGFTARLYTMNGRTDVSAKADGVHVVANATTEID